MQKRRVLSELHRIESAEDEPYRRTRLSDWRPTEKKSKKGLINIGDEIAFRHKYGNEVKTGYIKNIKRSGNLYIYLVEDRFIGYHIITTNEYYIAPTGHKRSKEG